MIKASPLKFSILFCSDLLDLYEKASKGGEVSLESFIELAENHSIQVVGLDLEVDYNLTPKFC